MKGGHYLMKDNKQVSIKNSSSQMIKATGQSKNSYGKGSIKKGTDLRIKK